MGSPAIRMGCAPLGRAIRTAAVACLLASGLTPSVRSAGSPVDRSAAAPNLRLEWLSGKHVVHGTPDPVTAPIGKPVRVAYRLRNVGGGAAFAVVLRARTALGSLGKPVRLQPGPAAGVDWDRSLTLAIARGMRELCIEAALQTLRAEDPGDPVEGDNRICRKVAVSADGHDTSQHRPGERP